MFCNCLLIKLSVSGISPSSTYLTPAFHFHFGIHSYNCGYSLTGPQESGIRNWPWEYLSFVSPKETLLYYSSSQLILIVLLSLSLFFIVPMKRISLQRSTIQARQPQVAWQEEQRPNKTTQTKGPVFDSVLPSWPLVTDGLVLCPCN